MDKPDCKHCGHPERQHRGVLGDAWPCYVWPAGTDRCDCSGYEPMQGADDGGASRDTADLPDGSPGRPEPGATADGVKADPAVRARFDTLPQLFPGTFSDEALERLLGDVMAVRL